MLGTYTIQINNSKALQLIKDLEALDLIKILPQQTDNTTSPSDLLKGSISKKQAEEWKQELIKTRNEWQRDS